MKNNNALCDNSENISLMMGEGENRAPSAPVGLLTNESEYPMNIEGAPLFDWWVCDPDTDDCESAYQIRLYDGVLGDLVWDSGRVESDEQNCVEYGGAPLKRGYPYSWQVRTWDRLGEASPFSERARFATGLENGDWNAAWIQGVEYGEGGERRALVSDNCYWCCRKSIGLDGRGQVAYAVAYVAASQEYELSVNGRRIGRAGSYDYLGETKYQGWDITDAVADSDSLTVGILAAYFGGGQGRAVTKPGLIAKFIIYFTDGDELTLSTDESWLTHPTGYYNCEPRNSEGDEVEYCDARLMISGFSEREYNTEGWVPVMIHGEHPTESFTSLEPEVGHVAESIVSAVGVTRLEDGTTVADFGRVIPAAIIIHFPSGTAGQALTIQEGYEICEDGRINTTIQSTQHTKMTYVYIMKDGEQTFEAWSFLGFRYVSLPPEAGVLTAGDFKAKIFHAETVSGRVSTLETSDEMINEVFELCRRSGLYSVQNQFIDTPTREKGQFLVDAVNSSAATTSASFERQATRKAILQFLDSSDRHWSDSAVLGMYNAVYPNIEGCRGIPDFSLYLPKLVWRYYLLTADRGLLEKAYPYMKNTADFVTRYTNPETGLVTALPGGGEHRSYSEGIIDSPPGRFGYDWKGTLGGARTTVNALGVMVYSLVVKMAEELGEGRDAEAYRARRDTLRAAINSRLITESGVYADGLTREGEASPVMSQHSTSHAIMADIPESGAVAAMADYIASLGMRQSPMTADTLVGALFKSGHGDAAIRLLTNTEDYGWAKLINEGYTYTWENWQSGSQSHGWGSATIWQLIEYISGVSIIEAGAKRIRISPAVGALDWVKSHTVTARGNVDISYSGAGKDYKITVDIPTNMTAEIAFPIVGEGKFVDINGKCGKEIFTKDAQTVIVGGGRRSFAYAERDSF